MSEQPGKEHYCTRTHAVSRPLHPGAPTRMAAVAEVGQGHPELHAQYLLALLFFCYKCLNAPAICPSFHQLHSTFWFFFCCLCLKTGSPGWPQNHHVIKASHDLLVLLSSAPRAGTTGINYHYAWHNPQPLFSVSFKVVVPIILNIKVHNSGASCTLGNCATLGVNSSFFTSEKDLICPGCL